MMANALSLVVVSMALVSVVSASCTAPASKWEEYACAVSANPSIQPKCKPVYHKTTKPLKGLVVAFHGYTACVDAFDGMAEAWIEDGYNVMVPLLVGHGGIHGQDCNATGNYCTFGDGDRVENLPLKRQGYVDYVAKINAIVADEKARLGVSHVISTGLSLGGALSTYAVSSGGGLYTQQLAMNPFFAMTSPEADAAAVNCDQDASACAKKITRSILESLAPNSTSHNGPVSLALAKLTEWAITEGLRHVDISDYAQLMAALRWVFSEMAEHPGVLPKRISRMVMETDFNWGASCENQRKLGRPGICSFRIVNLLAAHSFGGFAVRESAKFEAAVPESFQLVVSEIDGPGRSSLSVQVAQNFAKRGAIASACMFRKKPGCVGEGNVCRVPHSLLSRAEQTIVPPHTLYWEQGLQNDSVAFFDDVTPMGRHLDVVDPAVCEQLDIFSPPTDLVMAPALGVRMLLQRSLVRSVTKARGALSRFTGFLRRHTGIPSFLLVSSAREVAKGVHQVYFEIPRDTHAEDLELLEEAVFELGNSTDAAEPDSPEQEQEQVEVQSIQISGREAVLDTDSGDGVDSNDGSIDGSIDDSIDDADDSSTGTSSSTGGTNTRSGIGSSLPEQDDLGAASLSCPGVASAVLFVVTACMI